MFFIFALNNNRSSGLAVISVLPGDWFCILNTKMKLKLGKQENWIYKADINAL